MEVWLNYEDIDKKTVLRIIQISDLHLFADKNKEFLGVKPYNHCVEAIKNIQSLYKKNNKIPHLLIITGDISQDFSRQSYINAFELVNELNIPIKVTSGNHDKIDLLQQSFELYSSFLSKTPIHCNNWHIIMLDSHWDNHIAGLLSNTELDKLQHELQKFSNKNIMIFMHHNVMPTKINWLDKHILKNAEQFLAILQKYRNVKAVFSGHIHQEFHDKKILNELQQDIRQQCIDFFTTPALSWQFMPNVNDFQLDTKMPGYRLIDLYDNGTYNTEIVRLKFNQNYIPDLKAEGY